MNLGAPYIKQEKQATCFSNQEEHVDHTRQDTNFACLEWEFEINLMGKNGKNYMIMQRPAWWVIGCSLFFLDHISRSIFRHTNRAIIVLTHDSPGDRRNTFDMMERENYGKWCAWLDGSKKKSKYPWWKSLGWDRLIKFQRITRIDLGFAVYYCIG